MTLALWLLSGDSTNDAPSADAAPFRDAHDVARAASDQSANTTRDNSATVADADVALVAHIRQGDQSAFATVFDTYYSALYRTTYRIVHSREIAEELVQDIFLTLWRDRAGWTLRTSLSAYLHTAARNRAVQWLRREMVARRFAAQNISPEDGLAMSAYSVSGGRDTEANDLDDALRRAVADLPERVRLAIMLRWRHGLRNAEVAVVMGVSVKAVEANLARGLRRLREILIRFGITGAEG